MKCINCVKNSRNLDTIVGKSFIYITEIKLNSSQVNLNQQNLRGDF